MPAASHSPLATALLLIPILTVPLLAIFGVPEIMPIVPKALEERRPPAAAQANASEFVPGPARNWQDFGEPPVSVASEPLENAWPDVLADSTARTVAERRADAVRQIPTSRSSFNDRDVVALDANPENPSAPSELMGHASSKERPTTQPPPEMALGYKRPPQQTPPVVVSPARVPRNPAAVPAESLTWQAAVRRLNELEIRNFRLEPGQQSESFVFICSYTLPDNPRVSYRFEAEADEPLRAVEKVLSQIDAWLAAR